MLERIAALPDAEEYLAAEPDVDSGEADEDAYAQWMSGLYAYAQEALAIQEEIEKLTEEQRAQISEAEMQKLAAWAATAQTAEESTQVMTADVAPQVDSTDSGDWKALHWEFDSTSGTLTVSGSGEMGTLGDSSYGWHSHRADIKKIVITSGVTTIGWNAFRDCPALTEVEISGTVTYIGNNAFYGCTSLSKVTIPNSVTEIGVNAFLGCTALEAITIPGSVTNVPDKMFYQCSDLESVTIENGVETIGNNVFVECNKLTAITIPGSVTSIGLAFYKCSSLKDVTFEGTDTIPTLHESCFDLNTSGSLTCPCVKNGEKGLHISSCQYLEAYKAKEGWSKFSKNIDAPHTLSYTASGAIITQACANCDLSARATLSADKTEYTYTGNAIKPAKITYDSNWVGDKQDIVYEDNVNPGTAKAKLTIAGITAEFTFKILAQTYDVTVNNGTGSGNYEAGVTVRITANAPASGQQFDKWVVNSGNVTLASATSAATTFTMPAGAVSVTATYKESDASRVAAAKTVVENTLAGITATNETTKEKILDAFNKALSDAGITDVTVEIDKFQKSEATTSAAGYTNGVIFIRCGEESETINGMGINGGPKPIAQLEAGKYVVAVNSGTGSGNYEAGVTVRITANAPASGQQFDKWVVNSGNVTLASATSAATTFIMPAEAVSATATYKTDSGGGSGSGNTGGSGDSGSGNNNSDNGGSNNNSDSGSGSSGGNNNDGSGNSGSSAGDNGSNVGSGSSVQTTPVEIPEIRITTPQEELEDALLAETEKQQKAGGADIRIELDVDVVTAEASAADRALVEEALHGSAAGYTVGQYLDINLYKVIGDSRTAIRETDGKLTIRIDVPDSLKNTDNSRTRTFAVIRVHEGRTELLADLDNDADTITIETDRFSTYAVVFKDTTTDVGKPNSGKDAEPKTGDATPLELYATLSMIAGLSYLLVYFSDRKRGMTEEIKRELVSRLVGWAKQGGKLRKCLALAAIFVLLVYYHSIGKKTCVAWREIYGE